MNPLILGLVSLIAGGVFGMLNWVMHRRDDTGKRDLRAPLTSVGAINGGLGLYLQQGLWPAGA